LFYLRRTFVIIEKQQQYIQTQQLQQQ